MLDPTEIASTLPDQKPIPKSKKAAASSRASKKLKVEQPPGKENLKEEGSSQPVDSKVVDQPKGEEEERQMVTALKKGAAIVDPKCPIADRVHVYSQGNDVYGMTFLNSR